MLTLTMFGKKRQITGKQFAVFGILAVCFFIVGLIGLYKLGGWMLLLGAIILSASFSTEDHRGERKYAIIQNEKARSIFSGIALWSGVIYFAYSFFK